VVVGGTLVCDVYATVVVTDLADLTKAVARFPREIVAHTPTPIDSLTNLGRELGISLFAKRDDLTGVGFGGNKVRQLEFYFGEATRQGADTVLITGAVQSNFALTAAAVARRLDMECHIQLEERVPDVSDLYRDNGNVLLGRLLGATLHSYPDGEDEAGADAAVVRIAEKLADQGRRPYIVPLGAGHPPLGALGYVLAAVELAEQMDGGGRFDEIVLGSGSSLTHVGLLYGFRALGIDIPIRGICVRRDAESQAARVAKRLADLETMLGLGIKVSLDDILLSDDTLSPGYGRPSDRVTDAIVRTAKSEGLFLDPVYTGKVMAGLFVLADAGDLAGDRVLFWHTGGQPALFGYADHLTSSVGDAS
jgi:D-cysteine desulfhydrase family pyridoxal phosphate-dependent enzyme